MEYKILNTRRNDLIGREEIILQVHQKPTPSRTELLKLIAEMNKKPELSIIKQIRQEFGKHECIVKIFCYQDEKRMKKFEPNYALKRHELALQALKKQTQSNQTEEKSEAESQQKTEPEKKETKETNQSENK